MNIMKELRTFVLYENILFIFRNISFSSTKVRILMFCALAAETLLSVTNGVVSGYFYIFAHKTDLLYFYIALGNSILFIFFACYHSQLFKKLSICFDRNKNFVMNDSMYLKNFGRGRKFLVLILILYVVLEIAFAAQNSRYSRLKGHELVFSIGVIFQINASIWHIRFLFEFIFMYSILYFMSEQLQCITRSVERKKTLMPLIYDPKKMDVSPKVDNQYLNEISQWSLAYTYLTEASNLFNRIFGMQMTIMVVSVIAYICIVLYATAITIILNIYETFSLIKFVLKLIIYLTQIFSLSRVAQRLLNNVDNLKRCLAKLLIETLTDEESYRATKDLLRLVSSRPIRIQAFGSISVDMSLPPTCVMFFTSYTVIALQFNNVL
ncbi:uncharacterized protein [Battus philenor]|uniref:uncharacterized protein n=1 Tax=Battus philenor TaxID=42288 RepID=UPI0035D0C7D6